MITFDGAALVGCSSPGMLHTADPIAREFAKAIAQVQADLDVLADEVARLLSDTQDTAGCILADISTVLAGLGGGSGLSGRLKRVRTRISNVYRLTANAKCKAHERDLDGTLAYLRICATDANADIAGL